MPEEDGVVSVAPEVIATIVRRTTANVSGVARLVPRSSSGMGRVFRGNSDDGVSVSIDDNKTVSIDVNLIVEAGANAIDLGKRLQKAIERSIEELVGMHVEAVNVHIEDVTFVAPEQ